MSNAHWELGRYKIAVQHGKTDELKGFHNGIFGIKFYADYGFRVTHIPSGWLMGQQFFTSLRDAVDFVNRVEALTDWRTFTANCIDFPRVKAAIRPIIFSYPIRMVDGGIVRNYYPEAA